MFRLSACFGKFVLQESLFRRGCRRATFPKGEGFGATSYNLQNKKCHEETNFCSGIF